MKFFTRKNSLLILLLAQCAVYFQSVGFPWLHYDDYHHIFENPLIVDSTFSNLLAFWKAPFFGLYIPVTYTSWFTLALISKEPWIFHLANVVLHLACSFLVFHILFEIFEREGHALAGALLFALHPIQAEAVSWISGFKDCFFATFYLSSVFLYLQRLKGVRPRPNALFLGLFLLTVFSKPMGLTLPLVLLLFRRVFRSEPWKESLKALSILLVLILPLSLFVKSIQPDFQVKDLAPLWFRPVVALHAVGFYLKQLVFPAAFQMDYGRSPSWLLLNWRREAMVLLPILISLYGLFRFRQRKIVWLGAGLILIPLLPVLGFVPYQFQLFSTVADRYFYLSMLGGAVLFAEFIRHLPKPTLAAPFLSLLLLGGMAFLQVSQWRSNETIFSQTLERNPKSFLAHNNLAYVYFQRREFDRASEHAKISSQLHPEETGLSMNYTATLVKSGRTQEAIQVLREVLRREPNHPQAQQALQRLQPNG